MRGRKQVKRCVYVRENAGDSGGVWREANGRLAQAKAHGAISPVMRAALSLARAGETFSPLVAGTSETQGDARRASNPGT